MFHLEHQGRGPRHTGRHFLRVLAPAACALALLGLAAAPSAARQDAGKLATTQGTVGQCHLERVGTQFVRCDDLTGNGVPAPAWIRAR